MRTAGAMPSTGTSPTAFAPNGPDGSYGLHEDRLERGRVVGAVDPVRAEPVVHDAPALVEDDLLGERVAERHQHRALDLAARRQSG